MTPMANVALLAEGVDRNLIGLDVVLDPANVALLAEGVDRNWFFMGLPPLQASRPPRGGRG